MDDLEIYDFVQGFMLTASYSMLAKVVEAGFDILSIFAVTFIYFHYIYDACVFKLFFFSFLIFNF